MDSLKSRIDMVNDIQEEILQIGWNGVIAKYHPDNNTKRTKRSLELFMMYKRIYEAMKKKLIIDG